MLSTAVTLSTDGSQDVPSRDVDRRGPTGTGWRIVDVFPLPEGASGLAYDGTYLYCGIYGANGDEVYRINPDTGGSSLLFTGPQEDAFGLTYDGSYLWTIEHPGGSAFPAVAMKLDWDGSLLGQFDLPAHYISGIAYDNGDFWVARYYPEPGHLYKVSAHGAILDEFDAPDNQPWDLCIENDHLWMADYWGDTLYKIDPTTADLLDSHSSEGVDPAGIVWDGEFLWYCDNGEGGVDFLYKVDLRGSGADCNGNGVPDSQDIAECEGAPTCSDCNENGLPDECDTIVDGDFEDDGDGDLDDYMALADFLAGPDEPPTPAAPECVDACLRGFDMNDDGDVDLADFAGFEVVFTGSGPQMRAQVHGRRPKMSRGRRIIQGRDLERFLYP